MRRLAAVVACVALLTACSAGSGDPPQLTRDVSGVTNPTIPSGADEPASTDPSEPLQYDIAWTQLSDDVDEGWLTVPLDYSDPQGETIDLYVTRHRAGGSDPIGPMLANRGGPGADGATFGLDATSWFGSEITDNFDVIGWDPRGTGESQGVVDCIDDDQYDYFLSTLDITPDDDDERQAIIDRAEEFAEHCVDRVDSLQYVGTNNSARDMDAIRRALGADQVSYFGFSYGSELGGVWATMFPTTVRAAVFDGARDPDASALEWSLQQGAGFESSLDTFLAECSANTSCEFHNDGDAAAAFDRLMERLDEHPLPSAGGRPEVGLGVAAIALAQSMYSESYWPEFERALAAAAAGDGAGLLQIHDAYYQRQADGSYGNMIESFQAINCADDEERQTVEESDAEVDQILAVARRIFPYTTGSYSCTFFPEALDPRIEITGAGAGPIVVVGTTGDPATPLTSSKAMADTLEDGRLVIADANEHTGYRSNECVQDVVHEYLIHLVAPDDGTVCS